VWSNDGSAHFFATAESFGAGATRGCSAADFDGDGDLDLVCSDASAGEALWTNDGAGHLSHSGLLPSLAGSGAGLAACDVDRDGDLDLVALRAHAADRVLLNR
jgi:hypothetical protein